MSDENGKPPDPAPVKRTRKRTRLCASCGASEPTGHFINGVELLECRRRAPESIYGDIRGRRAHAPLKLATEWCGEWLGR